MKIFSHTPNFPFVKMRFVFLAVSAVMVLASLAVFWKKGLNYGTDFTGGVKLQYLFSNEVSENDVRKALEGLSLGDVSVIRYGDAKEKRLIIKVSNPAVVEEAATGETTSVAKTVTPKLLQAFGENGASLEMEETVGPKVGSELRRKGVLTVFFSLFCMLIFIGFRLDFYFAPGAIIALFHDVAIPLGLFALFGFEFNLTILAAFLTIVGYSINDSIIVFDRIREHARLVTPSTLEEVVNRSLNETLSRTILTSLTVFFVVVVLYLFGGETIKGFAFAMTMGTVLGTISTVSIVCPLYIALYRLAPRLKARFEKK